MPAGRPPGPPKNKVTVSLDEELRRYVDDEIRRRQLAGELPETFSRSDWINEAIRLRREAEPPAPPSRKRPRKPTK